MNKETFRIMGSVLLEDKDFINGLQRVLNNAESATQQLAQKFQNAGKSISNIGKTLTTTMTLPIAGLLGTGIKYNAQMEQYQVALTTLTGSADEANKIIEQIKKDASATPFDVAGLVQANQLLISTGLSGEDSRETILALGDAVSATGGGNDELSRLAVNLQQIKNTGKATALDIKQFAFAGIDIFGMLSDYTGKTKEEVAEMDVTWEVLNGALIKATQEGGRYFGAMQNQSETTNGRISTLKDNFMEMTGVLTESLMPVFENIVDKLSEFVAWFSSLDEQTRQNIVNALLLVGALGPVLMIVGKIVSAIGTAIKVFNKIKTAITGCSWAMKALTAVWGAITSPVGIWITVIMAVIGVIILLWNKCDWFRNGVIEIWNRIKEAFVTAVDQIVYGWNVFMEFLAGIPEWINTNIVTPIVNFFKALWDGIVAVWNGIKSITTTVWNTIVSVVTSVVNRVKSVVTSVFNAIKSFVNTVWNGIKNYIINPIKNAYDKVVGFVTNIKDKVVAKFNDIKAKVSSIWTSIKEKITKPIKDAKEKVTGWIDDIKEAFNNFKAKLKMPHIKIKNGSWNPADWVKNGVPKFSVEWYKKGGIFDKPTLFATNSGVKGVGEAGPEAVAPISELMKYTRLAVDGSNLEMNSKLDTLVDILLTYMPALLERDLVLDGNALVGRLAPRIDRELGDLTNKKGRGR